MTDAGDFAPLFSPEVVTHPDGTISVLSAKANETITRSIRSLRDQSDRQAGTPTLAMADAMEPEASWDRIAVFKVGNMRETLFTHISVASNSLSWHWKMPRLMLKLS